MVGGKLYSYKLNFELEVESQRAYSDLNEVQDLYGLVHDHGDWFIQ